MYLFLEFLACDVEIVYMFASLLL